MSDPSNFVTDPPSVIVKVINTAREDVNGQLGLVLNYQSDRQRYLVQCMTNSELGTLALKPQNLAKASTMESVKAQFIYMKDSPYMRRQYQQYYQKAQSYLPPQVKPEYAAFGSLLLLFVGGYFFGFTKLTVLISLVAIVALIVLPDLLSSTAVSWKVILRNFPTRCRELTEQTVPFLKGKISNRVAMMAVLMMLTLGGRTLFTSSMPKKIAPMDLDKEGPSSSASLSMDSIKEYYKLGFEDATAGKSFGSSIPTTTSSQVSSDEELLRELDDMDDIPIDYTKDPDNKKSAFGMSQAMSLFLLARTLGGLAQGPDGSWNVAHVAANIQTMDTWKWGLVGYGLYNVLSPLF